MNKVASTLTLKEFHIFICRLCCFDFDFDLASYLYVQAMAQMVTDHMEKEGTKFLWRCAPKEVHKGSDGRLKVTFLTENGETKTDVFDTVLLATGNI
jgi:hypothetical protein